MNKRKLVRTAVCFLLVAGLTAEAAPGPLKASGPDVTLEAVLAKAQSYCQRLDGAALDFTCREEVKEKTNTRSQPQGISMQNMPTFVSSKPGALRVAPPPAESFLDTTYLYDYQYTRNSAGMKQRRDLLKKGGDDLEEYDTRVKTLHFAFADIFFGPSRLLSQTAADTHVYTLLKTEKIKGQPAAVIVCAPKDIGGERVLSGKAWVRITDGAVLKIEWDPTTLAGWKEVLVVADRFKMKPQIKSVTEFRVEQNGLRFPSQYVTEEAYDGGGANIFTRSVTSAKYEDYKFTTVEIPTEVIKQ